MNAMTTHPIRALALALVVLLLAPLGAAEANEKRKKKKGKKAKAQATAETSPAPAASPIARSPEAKRIDKLLLAYDTDAARQALSEVMDEKDPQLLAARGRVAEQEKDYRAAVADLEAAANMAPEDPAPLVYLGEAHLHVGDEAAAAGAFAGAEERARRLVAARPEDAEAVYLLGVAQQGSLRLDEAWKTLQKAQQLAPDNALVLYQLGLTRNLQERWADAVALFDQALERDPGIAYGYYYRGLSASKLDRKDLLVNDMHRFLDLAPNSPEAPAARRILEAAY